MTFRSVQAPLPAAAIVGAPGAGSTDVFVYMGDIGRTFSSALGPACETCGSGEIYLARPQ
jgi:hypothetical protein